ncbi:L-threonine ammonia-lyase-like [Tachypleus tridentatus]|uniref:L-threonine ammonia-lyase-like n=1 Tax=Tachypleus tridentatus TaxID=6853 RepID=UPI003FD14536
MPADNVNCSSPRGSNNDMDGLSSQSPVASKDIKEDCFDPVCDPSNPVRIKFQDICSAAYTIKGGIITTLCMKSHMSSTLGCNVYFKKDFLQYTGSFKERGARNMLTMMTSEHKQKGVITASAGNHALALSYHGQKLGVPVTVVMPIIAPIMKITLCRQFGAKIIIKGADIGESKEHAMQLSKENSLVYVNGYDHPHIIAGQGTMGLEIIDQVPDIDAVVVPIGGGGLIAGLALAVKSLKPEVKVIGVESERCPSFTAAMNAGHPVTLKAGSTLADGLAVPKVGVNAFHTAAHLLDKVVVVKESFIALSILRLVEMDKAVVEGAGACGLAALIAGQLPELQGKNVVVPLCGGNIDTTVLGRCLERGLAVDGRLIKFTVTVSDRPGGISELVGMISKIGVSIKDIIHERAWLTRDIFSVQVKVVGETRDRAHAQELENALRATYNEVHFVSTGDTS